MIEIHLGSMFIGALLGALLTVLAGFVLGGSEDDDDEICEEAGQ